MDFSKRIIRYESNSRKYRDKKRFSFTLADMDFFCPPSLKIALEKATEFNLYGYSFLPEEYFLSFIDFKKRISKMDIKREELSAGLNLMFTLSILIQGLTNEDDGVVIFPPTYHNFSITIKKNKRNCVESPLIFKDNNYYIDMENLEKVCQNDNVKLCLICSPNNPSGRIWTKKELEDMHKICKANNVILIADEIYSDLIYENQTFISLHSLQEDNTIVMYSPVKTFNMANLPSCFAISRNKRYLEILENYYDLNRLQQSIANVFSIQAAIAVYKDKSEYLEKLLKVIQENKKFILNLFNEKDLGFNAIESTATFLLWVDANAFYKKKKISPKEFEKILALEEIYLNMGESYGNNSKNFFRINLASPLSELKIAFQKIVEIVEQI